MPAPGGWELWEPATDLAAVFLGFGVLSGQWTLPSIFTHLLQLPLAATMAHLKPALRGTFKRLCREVAGATAELEKLRVL